MGVIVSLILGIAIGLKLYRWQKQFMEPFEDLGYLLRDWRRKRKQEHEEEERAYRYFKEYKPYYRYKQK